MRKTTRRANTRPSGNAVARAHTRGRGSVLLWAAVAGAIFGLVIAIAFSLARSADRRRAEPDAVDLNRPTSEIAHAAATPLSYAAPIAAGFTNAILLQVS